MGGVVTIPSQKCVGLTAEIAMAGICANANLGPVSLAQLKQHYQHNEGFSIQICAMKDDLEDEMPPLTSYMMEMHHHFYN